MQPCNNNDCSNSSDHVSVIQKFSCVLVKERKLLRLKDEKEDRNNDDDDNEL